MHSPPDPSLFAEVDLACMGWDSNMVRKFNVDFNTTIIVFFNDIHSSNWPHFLVGILLYENRQIVVENQ